MKLPICHKPKCRDRFRRFSTIKECERHAHAASSNWRKDPLGVKARQDSLYRVAAILIVVSCYTVCRNNCFTTVLYNSPPTPFIRSTNYVLSNCRSVSARCKRRRLLQIQPLPRIIGRDLTIDCAASSITYLPLVF